MTVEIVLPGGGAPFVVATDGDPAFLATEIRKMAAEGDGYVVLRLADGGLLLLNPSATWIGLRSVPDPGSQVPGAGAS